LRRPTGLRRWYRGQVRLDVDGEMPFKPLPFAQAMPMFEWGLNWCISNHASPFLILHAASVEKDGCAVIMPGLPGAGKSTLTAGLVSRGWRLLSDELTLISLADGQQRALARPISLKNESIDVIRAFAPHARLGTVVRDTVKGEVALLRPPAESVARVAEPARPTWIVFPKYVHGLPAVLERRTKAAAMLDIAKNAFNYSIHGARAFSALSTIVDSCACFDFSYALLEDAVEVFGRLEPPS
jgi:HprK-related kinase A